MNAFLRGFTKVFSGNFYASPRMPTSNTNFNYLEQSSAVFKRDFHMINFFEEPEQIPLTVKATLIYKDSNKKIKRNPVI